MSAPLVPITLAFLVGVAYRLGGPLSVSWTLVLAVYAAGMALQHRLDDRVRAVGLLVLWLCLGVLRTEGGLHASETRLRGQLAEAPAPMRAHGIVSGDPAERVPLSARGQVAELDLLHADPGAGWRPMAGRLRATLEDPRVRLRYGDEVLVEGRGARLPDRAVQRLDGRLTVTPHDGLIVLRRGRGHPWVAAAYRLRARWVRAIQEACDREDAGLLLSMVLGQRTVLDRELKRAFTQTGTMHLLIVSGFNVGLLALLFELLFRLLGCPRGLRLLGSAMLLGGYALVTDLQPPVVRATLMAWVVLGGVALDRAVSWPNTLAAAALVMLWIHPAQLLDPGFQLSFGAVASLLAFTARWQARLEPALGWIHPARLRRYLAVSASATGAIWVGLWPLLAWTFHLVSPVSLPANLLLAPLVSALVLAGTTLLLLGTAWAPMLQWGAPALTLLVRMTRRCVLWCHAVPWGSWWVAPPSLPVVAGYYGLLGLTLVGLRRNWRVQHLLLCWAAALAIWSGALVAQAALASRWLTVDLLEAGQGALMRTPRGTVLVVDAGLGAAGAGRVVSALHAQGLAAIDTLLLSRADAGRVSGAIRLVQELRVTRLLTNARPGDTMSARHLQWLAAQRGIPLIPLTSGMRVELEPDLALDVEPAGVVRVRKGVVRLVIGRPQGGEAVRLRTDGLRLFINE